MRRNGLSPSPSPSIDQLRTARRENFSPGQRRGGRALARLVTLEAGKISSESLGEVVEMIDICDFVLFHHFLEVLIADRIRHLPTDTPQAHVSFKIAALEFDHRAVPLQSFPAIVLQAPVTQRLREDQKSCKMHILWNIMILKVD
jgi:hypothetical protein